MLATFCAIVAIAHLSFEIVPKPYPAVIGFGVPLAIAVIAAVDRQSIRSFWLPLLIPCFAIFNAGRFGASWLIPLAFAVVAVWLFRESFLLSREQNLPLSQSVWWIAGAVILVLLVAYGLDIVVAILGIPTTD